LEGIFYFFIAFLVVLLILNKYIKWWIKSLFVVYYVILIYLFSKGYKKINHDYDLYRSKNEYNYHDPADVAALEKFWDVRSNYVGSFEAYLHLPVLALLLYSYYKWIKYSKNKKQRILISLSMIPVGIIYFLLAVFIGMLGYRP
jgi:Ca2+/Na+ antiporter